ncbi:HU family DNA-binding protein [Streptomyces sp. 3213.3]|uniref:HU family DNA-binding protein n=1 Tax=Streptomyces sp. 3213.3 TaxID=1855348 RepID=UPI0013597CF2
MTLETSLSVYHAGCLGFNCVDTSQSAAFSAPAFGTFYRGTPASRRGMNPITKEFIQLPATVRPAFRPGDRLRRGVRRNPRT